MPRRKRCFVALENDFLQEDTCFKEALVQILQRSRPITNTVFSCWLGTGQHLTSAIYTSATCWFMTAPPFLRALEWDDADCPPNVRTPSSSCPPGPLSVPASDPPLVSSLLLSCVPCSGSPSIVAHVTLLFYRTCQLLVTILVVSHGGVTISFFPHTAKQGSISHACA